MRQLQPTLRESIDSGVGGTIRIILKKATLPDYLQTIMQQMIDAKIEQGTPANRRYAKERKAAAVQESSEQSAQPASKRQKK